ncbi:type I-C CRISPR-associated protein Cas8c/Csd1 [Marinithermus hydrothermalis]|uniref:CRISPR-associated protein, Csd1 family n=1 Tax=Marinithermus hydrothermalis (strain DSM 14884 / JCM 11576 / T1) TaxID=869210 RepID=F2NNM2_MARHT|nr:type I-C CRISPR-associated protein Cas8c/Csd1 [Marinithermus hydrothermalis]AEB11037.1 CRISPR-associated protein, Csd1 family [Marinithermus hydrothermalis DSM 14884]
MFKALVELGKALEQQGKLPPPGYYYYKEPIRWRVRVFPDRFLLTPIDRNAARPFSGRTSGVQAHFLVDEAGYALGVDRTPKGSPEKRAKEKFAAFCALLEKFLSWPDLRDKDLAREVERLLEGLRAGWGRDQLESTEIFSKEWVEFVPEVGPLQGTPLFEHPEAVRFWVTELAERAAPRGGEVIGQCAVCGQHAVRLVGRIPLGVKLVGNAPLHSFNQSAFPSYYGGSSPENNAHIGLCLPCADTASRAFNYLSQSENHRKSLISDSNKRDALTNQIALFWTKSPSAIEIGTQNLNGGELNALISEVLSESFASKPITPKPTLPQLQQLLSLPWRPVDSHLNLDDYGFYLAVLSPNVGRIALRDWMAVSLTTLKETLRTFLSATCIVPPGGGPAEPRAIGELVRALESANPNHLRGLLRTAYLGDPPPAGLLQAAVVRFRNARVLENPRESWRLRALASLLKLTLFYGKKEVERMEKLNPSHKTPAYLSGRLLAVLEEAQKRAQGFNLKRTLVERFYGAASTAPAATFGMLLRTAAVAHLPKAGRLNLLVEEILGALDDAGGFPKTLTLKEQAEFALGFYHQRASFREKTKEENLSEAEVQHE